MPIYEYACQKCGHKFEQLQKITDTPLQTCPNCEQVSLVKLVSNTSFQLKGSGWYVTDFKNPKPEKAHASKKENAVTTPNSSTKDQAAVKPAAEKTTTATKSQDSQSTTTTS